MYLHLSWADRALFIIIILADNPHDCWQGWAGALNNTLPSILITIFEYDTEENLKTITGDKNRTKEETSLLYRRAKLYIHTYSRVERSNMTGNNAHFYILCTWLHISWVGSLPPSTNSQYLWHGKTYQMIQQNKPQCFFYINSLLR